MTDTATLEPEARYLTDAEVIRRMGFSEKKGRHILRHLDNNPQYGFPKKDPIFGDKRYWPAIEKYLDERNKPTMMPLQKQRGRS